MLVVFYHFRVISHLSALDIVKHGDVAVDFFFVLSGFVLAYAYSARLKRGGEVVVFVLRRVGRLYPLHLATLAILVLVELVHLGLTTTLGNVVYRPAFQGPTSLPALAANLALLHGLGLFHSFSWNVPSWSISVELYVSILFAALAATRHAKVLLFGLFVAVFLVRLILWLNKIWPFEGELALIRGFCGFFLGVQVYNLLIRTRKSFKTGAKSIELLFPLAFYVVITFENHGIGFLNSLIFGVLVFVFSFESGIISKILKNRVFQYFGKISYSIYMIHYIVILIVFGLANFRGRAFGITLRMEKGSLFLDAGSKWAGDVVQLCLVAAVIGCAALSYNFVEVRGRLFFNRRASNWSIRFRQS